MYGPNIRAFNPPSDENAAIWRYMDFTKFISLLESRCLHFTRPDQFADPFEGAVPTKLRQRLTEYAQNSPHMRNRNPLDNHEAVRRITCVNCWHVSEHESEAMWKLYLKSDEGIAVRSTYKRLIGCFGDRMTVAIHVGMVKYIDYDSDDLTDGNLLAGLMHKRKSFEHERELRAVAFGIYERENEDGTSFSSGITGETFPESGCDIAVDIKTLIESVYVSPVRHTWFKDLVESMVRRYELPCDVRQSSLVDGPVW